MLPFYIGELTVVQKNFCFSRVSGEVGRVYVEGSRKSGQVSLVFVVVRIVSGKNTHVFGEAKRVSGDVDIASCRL